MRSSLRDLQLLSVPAYWGAANVTISRYGAAPELIRNNPAAAGIDDSTIRTSIPGIGPVVSVVASGSGILPVRDECGEAALTCVRVFIDDEQGSLDSADSRGFGAVEAQAGDAQETRPSLHLDKVARNCRAAFLY